MTSALVMLLLVTCFLLAETVHRLLMVTMRFGANVSKLLLSKVKATALLRVATHAFYPPVAQEPIVRSGCSFRRDWWGAHGQDALSLMGLPLSPAGQGPRFSVLLVDCDPESSNRVELFLLKRNAAVTLLRSAGRALELLQVSYYNIVIVDVNALGPAEIAQFHALASAHSLLFVGVVADRSYADDYALFDMQALRPLNETTMDIILKVEEITAQKLFLLERSAAASSPSSYLLASSNGKGGTTLTTEISPTTSSSHIQHTDLSPPQGATNGGRAEDNYNSKTVLSSTDGLRIEKSFSILVDKLFRNVVVCGGSG